MFHSLTGCVSITGLLGIPKPTAFKKWLESSSSIMSAMSNLKTSNSNLVCLDSETDTVIVERFISSMYWQSSISLDYTRLDLFLHKGTPLMKLPLTSHSFINKIIRSMFQSSIWTQSTVKRQILPDPESWGFVKAENSNNLDFDWRTEPDYYFSKEMGHI